jgi:hypothetical protein
MRWNKLLLAIPRPLLVDQIFLKLIMHIVVSNSFVRGNEAGYSLLSPKHLHMASHIVIVQVIIVLPSLILDDHIMQDETSRL